MPAKYYCRVCGRKAATDKERITLKNNFFTCSESCWNHYVTQPISTMRDAITRRQMKEAQIASERATLLNTINDLIVKAKANRWTIPMIAKHLNTTRQTVNNWQHHTHVPKLPNQTIRKLKELAKERA